MSLNLAQLSSKVRPLYPDVESVNDTVLRYTRKAEQSEFAVYYLDVGDELPQTTEKLHDYLNSVVGERYFEGASSLQWNSYLYFIRSPERLQDTDALKAKELVEQDRAYARKFVISETEIDSVLSPKTLEAEGPEKAPDAISQWISILQKVNLVEPVFGEYALPKRMQLIEKPPYIESPRAHTDTACSGTLLPPIKLFKIEEFNRRYPLQREFSFGDVNLLFGANGTGKTSLLEAIELFYCGKSRRNPKHPEQYKFLASVNGKIRISTHKRQLQQLRDYNLDWYGVREQKSTNLCDGFGRFNFLNTDAAIELSQSSENKNIDGHLSKLLIGSDASKTWQVIEKLSEKVGTELKSVGNLRNQVRNELNVIIKQIAEIGSTKKESDLLRSALRDSLQRNNWTVDDDLDSQTDDIITDLTALEVTSKRIDDLIWLDAPVTLDIIDSYDQAAESIILIGAPQVEKLESLRFNQQQLNETTRIEQETINLIDEFSRFVKSGVEILMFDLETQRTISADLSSIATIVDEETLKVVAEAKGGTTVYDYCKSAATDRERVEVELLDAKQENETFIKKRKHSISLAQELRAIAMRILEEEPSDECPLCHTEFPQGELPHHMAEGVDDKLEETAQILLGKVRSVNEALSNAKATEEGANLISKVCERLKLPLNTDLKIVFDSLNKVKFELAEARSRVKSLEFQIQELESQGMTLERRNVIDAQLNAHGINLAGRSQLDIQSLRDDKAKHLVEIKSQMEKNAQEEIQLQTSVSQAVRSLRPSEADPVEAFLELHERLAETHFISTELKRFLPRFRWDGAKPIREWAVNAAMVRAIAKQLLEALENERIAVKTRTTIVQRKDKLQKQDEKLNTRIKRLEEAQEAFIEIQRKYSLTALTKSALRSNRKSIETIFSQIHSPAEFKRIGEGWTLIRKLDDEKTPLTRISTGQRSAFALSVFLALNAQLRAGPQVIMIDDPIAHVDDLNCLSFLDYLREIALTGKRQIFFATASEKLGSLFDRKFDFLGRKFKRFNLTRAVGD